MSTNSTPSLGLTVQSLADGTSIIQRSLPTEFFLALKENVANPHEESTTPSIEFYSRTPDGRKRLGVPLSLCENGVGVDGGEQMVSLLPYGFDTAPAGMIQILVTWPGYWNDAMTFSIGPDNEVTLQQLATFAARKFRVFYEKASDAFLPGTHNANGVYTLGPNCVANYDNIALRRVWYGLTVWVLELSFTP
ncbi:hypothetical protein FA13DRAFT_1801393 [Coprinellus micaceus]|uniref:Uncharacterized protein n=1 Tax=Coprinellus micaceus TaxID=71717 RepID=A0A4Y7SE50_COPMI|nr:hypothetical protein FA13DRAFT_1801393 [Coprinellus micaceus]